MNTLYVQMYAHLRRWLPCCDCGEKKTKEWKHFYYDCFSEQPLYICDTCWNLPKHKERMLEWEKDQISYDNREDDDGVRPLYIPGFSDRQEQ